MTSGAGITYPPKNDAYTLKLRDMYENIVSCYIGRPEVIDSYFASSPLVNVHN